MSEFGNFVQENDDSESVLSNTSSKITNPSPLNIPDFGKNSNKKEKAPVLQVTKRGLIDKNANVPYSGIPDFEESYDSNNYDGYNSDESANIDILSGNMTKEELEKLAEEEKEFKRLEREEEMRILELAKMKALEKTSPEDFYGYKEESDDEDFKISKSNKSKKNKNKNKNKNNKKDITNLIFSQSVSCVDLPEKPLKSSVKKVDPKINQFDDIPDFNCSDDECETDKEVEKICSDGFENLNVSKDEDVINSSQTPTSVENKTSTPTYASAFLSNIKEGDKGVDVNSPLRLKKQNFNVSSSKKTTSNNSGTKKKKYSKLSDSEWQTRVFGNNHYDDDSNSQNDEEEYYEEEYYEEDQVYYT